MYYVNELQLRSCDCSCELRPTLNVAILRPRVVFFFKEAFGGPTYYVIRHITIYGNSCDHMFLRDLLRLPM